MYFPARDYDAGEKVEVGDTDSMLLEAFSFPHWDCSSVKVQLDNY